MSDFNGIVAGMAASAPRNSNEYLAEDGIFRCKICQQPTRTKLHIPGFGDFEPSITCDCDKQAEAARKERERQEELDRKRRICFNQPAMRAWSFEHDDRANAKLSDAMARYADHFPKFLKEGRGLLLFGSVGTGKSYYAACIANRVIDQGYSARMTNFATLTNDLSGMGEGKNRYIEDLGRYALLIIDDLGAERKSDYMQEIIFNIIDSRCRSGKPMIITTNLSGDEIKNPDNTGYARIYDRLLGCCFPQEISGPSRRKKELRDSFGDMRAILGL